MHGVITQVPSISCLQLTYDTTAIMGKRNKASRKFKLSIAVASTPKETIVKQLRRHYLFLEHLQWSLMTILFINLILFTCFHVLAIRDYWMRKRRMLRDQIVVRVDEKEGGDAEYLVSIYTSREHYEPTTAVTTIRLIGRALPGRIHDIGVRKRDYNLSIFGNLCQEKIVVTEDISLDPIIGIVIKTNQAGKHPTWNCKTIIVRNLKSNEAWFFRVKNEIGFARTIATVDPKELVTLNFCLTRRLRQEWRNGQHVYFGAYFSDRMSVYSMPQRIFVAVAVHLLLMCFTMIGLSITTPYNLSWKGLQEQMTRIHNEVEGNYGVSSFGLSLEGERGATVWFKQIIPSALLAAFFSTILGFIMISLFREREKYESGVSEMDHVVVTALRKLSHDRRLAKERAEIRAKQDLDQKALPRRKRSSSRTKTSTTSQYPPRDSVFEPAPPLPTHPSEVLHRLEPAEARALQRYLFIGGKYTQDPRYAEFASFPTIKEREEPTAEAGAVASGDMKQSSGTTDSSGSDGFYSEVALFDGVTDRSDSDSGYDQEHNVVQKYLDNIPDVKLPQYLGKPGIEFHEVNEVLPGERDPATYSRSCGKPPTAWIISTLLIAVALFGFAIMTVNGPAACVHPGLFTMMFITTFFMGYFFQNIIFENVKIYFIALFYAYNDWKLYNIIQDSILMPPNLSFQYRL